MTDATRADLLPMAITPGELLARVLEQRSIQKAEFGRQMGSDYQLVLRWTKGIGFSPKNRRRAEKALGLPDRYFDAGHDDEGERDHELRRREVFAAFLESDIGKTATTQEQHALNVIPIPPDRAPSVAFYQGMLLNYRGLLPQSGLAQNVANNERLDEEIQAKPTKPRRR